MDRYKKISELSPHEHDVHMRTGRLPETPEWRARVREALDDAGVGAAADELLSNEPKDVADMTAADHFDQLGGTR